MPKAKLITAHSLGDTVFVMYNNKIIKAKILSIEVLTTLDFKEQINQSIKYGICKIEDSGEVSCLSNNTFSESSLFLTKNQLLRSL